MTGHVFFLHSKVGNGSCAGTLRFQLLALMWTSADKRSGKMGFRLRNVSIRETEFTKSPGRERPILLLSAGEATAMLGTRIAIQRIPDIAHIHVIM